MLTFKGFLYEHRFLIEDRIQGLKDVFRGKLNTDHDQLAIHKDSDSIVDHFSSNADPTPKKVYTQWVLNQYKRGNIRQEDHPRIREALSNFEKYKGKLDKKDINQYKSISDIESAVGPHLGQATSGKEEKRIIKAEGADLVHSGNGVLIHQIKTEGAACLLGSGTKWCTAAKKNNMFSRYAEKGPLFIIQHQGRKFQFHSNADQMMDEEDNPITIDKLHPDIQREMARSEHSEIQKAGVLFNNPHTTPEHISKAIDDENPIMSEKALAHPNVNVENISKALNSRYEKIRKKAISHPISTPEHISKALNDIDKGVRRQAIRHPNVNVENISKALNDEDSVVQETAINHPKSTVDHISKALNSRSSYVRRMAITRSIVTPEHISKALNDEDRGVREAAIRNPSANSYHINKALDDKSDVVRSYAIRHANATPENISKALNDTDSAVRQIALFHRNVNTEHIDRGLADSFAMVRAQALQNPKATLDHISRGLADESEYVRQVAQREKKIRDLGGNNNG